MFNEALDSCQALFGDFKLVNVLVFQTQNSTRKDCLAKIADFRQYELDIDGRFLNEDVAKTRSTMTPMS